MENLEDQFKDRFVPDDPSKYTLEQIKAGLVGVNYTEEQLKQVLRDSFGYKEFPQEGIDDPTANKVIGEVSRLASSQSRLEKQLENKKKNNERKRHKSLEYKIVKRKNLENRPYNAQGNLKKILIKSVVWLGNFAIIAGFGTIITLTIYDATKNKLREQMYAVANSNHNLVLEDSEIVELGERLQEISGEKYISKDIEELKEKIDFHTKKETYRKYLRRYGE
jgi:hypothetical protein